MKNTSQNQKATIGFYNILESPQFFSGNANPLLDFIFVADPTSVEYNGRLYVYGTNDTQQLDSVGKYGKNTYQYIPFTGHAVHR